MTARLAILIAVATASPAAATDDNEAKLDQRFALAQAAYDEARFTEAAELWESLLAEGRYNPELFYNLGNAYAQDHRLGAAILNYRRAERLIPGHPELRLNFRNALAAAAVEAPAPHPLAALLRGATHRFWMTLAVSAFWTTMLVGCVFCFLRPGRAWWLRAGLLGAGAVGLGLAGGHVTALGNHPEEVVVMQPSVPVRFAPIPTSESSFSFSEGTVARVRARRDGMIEVQLGKQRGWVPATATERVWPPVVPAR